MRDAKLIFPVARSPQHLGVDAQRDVVDECSTVDTPDVHATLVVAGVERVEGAQRTQEVKPEVACEVVERTCGHHHEGQVALHGHLGHRCNRPVAAGHRERPRAVIRLLIPVMAIVSVVPFVHAAYRVSRDDGYRYPIAADLVERG